MAAWKSLTGAQLRAALRDRSVIVTAGCRKGRRDRMPKVPADARFPGRRVPLTFATVVAVTKDGRRCKLEADNGPWGGWVDLADVLFDLDVL